MEGYSWENHLFLWAIYTMAMLNHQRVKESYDVRYVTGTCCKVVYKVQHTTWSLLSLEIHKKVGSGIWPRLITTVIYGIVEDGTGGSPALPLQESSPSCQEGTSWVIPRGPWYGMYTHMHIQHISKIIEIHRYKYVYIHWKTWLDT